MATDEGKAASTFSSNLIKSMSEALGGWIVTGIIAVGVVKLFDAVDARLHPDERRAKKAKEQAELVVKFLPFLDEKAGHASDAAIAVLDYLRNETGLDEALARGVTLALRAKVTAPSDEAAVQAAVVIESSQRAKLLAAQSVPSVAVSSQADLAAAAKSVNTIVESAKPRVYVQAPRGDKVIDERLVEILSHIKRIGFLVPPVERFEAAKFPKNTQVRYFNDVDRASADRIVIMLKELGEQAVTAQRISLSAPKGQLELWLTSRE